MTVTTATRRLVPLAAVCEMLNISMRTGYRWIAENRFPIPSVRVGAKIMFRANVLEEFLSGEGA